MGNPEHLDILRQGVQVWNQWREEYRDIAPDLSFRDLSHMDLSGVHLDGVCLLHSKLNEANLSHATLVSANLFHANLRGANLSFARLWTADLTLANLTGVICCDAALIWANLSDATLRGANLEQANLKKVILARTDLSETNMRQAILGLTAFIDTDLSSVQGLDQVIHESKSYLSFETILRSHGNLPLPFLQGIGFSDRLIKSLHKQSVNPYEHPLQLFDPGPSCFLSYAKDDLPFAQKLQADLQQQGIRCWLDQECQLEEDLRFSIPRVLICSLHSVQVDWKNSGRPDWLFQEVIDGRGEEREHNRRLLVPALLDDTLFQLHDAWAEEFRQSRTMEDFTDWEHETSYQEAFGRLLSFFKAS